MEEAPKSYLCSNLFLQGISIRVASPKLVMEEAPESYKNVTDVVDTCHAAGISAKAIKLRPIAVIKGWGRPGLEAPRCLTSDTLPPNIRLFKNRFLKDRFSDIHHSKIRFSVILPTNNIQLFHILAHKIWLSDIHSDIRSSDILYPQICLSDIHLPKIRLSDIYRHKFWLSKVLLSDIRHHKNCPILWLFDLPFPAIQLFNNHLPNNLLSNIQLSDSILHLLMEEPSLNRMIMKRHHNNDGGPLEFKNLLHQSSYRNLVWSGCCWCGFFAHLNWFLALLVHLLFMLYTYYLRIELLPLYIKPVGGFLFVFIVRFWMRRNFVLDLAELLNDNHWMADFGFGGYY